MVSNNYAHSTELESICVKVTLEQRSHRHHQLSGGQLGRTCYAAIIVTSPLPLPSSPSLVKDCGAEGSGCSWWSDRVSLGVSIMGGEWVGEELDNERIVR